MRAYKFLAAGSRGRFSDAQWPTDGTRVEAAGEVEECHAGVHACLPESFLDWLDDELWVIELDDPVEVAGPSLVAAAGRIVGRVDGWDDDAARSLTESCEAAARANVIAAVRALGHEAAADDLARAASPDDVTTVADAQAAELVAFAVDCMLLARGGRPDETESDGTQPSPSAVAANIAYVGAHVCGRSAAAVQGDVAYAAAFAAERDRQLDWLRERVGV